MPVGDITHYDEQIDVGDNFNPSTGTFTVGNKKEDEGTYVFFYHGHNAGWKNAKITLFFNSTINNYKSTNHHFTNEEDTSNSLAINAIVSMNLRKGDVIWLHNHHDNIYASSPVPFTFTGYKI